MRTQDCKITRALRRHLPHDYPHPFNFLRYGGINVAFGVSDALGASCNRPPAAACTPLNVSVGVPVQLDIPLPLGFLTSGSDEVASAVLRDLARATGTSSNGLAVLGFRYGGA
jgi:hypothetical protein